MSAYDRPDLETGPVTEPAFGDTLERSALVTEFLAQLRAFADEPAPQPSPELAALLGGATPITDAPTLRQRRHRRHWRLAVAAAVGTAAVSVTGVAAANENLPQPAQRVVSDVVNDFTPFHINPSRLNPKPAVPGDDATRHHPEPGTEPTETHEPTRGADDTTSESNDSPEGGGDGETESTQPGGSGGDGSSDEHHESPSPRPSETGDHESRTTDSTSDGTDSHPSD